MTFPLAANITDPTAMIVYGNSVTENFVAVGILFTIYLSILTFLLMKDDIPRKDAFVTAIVITIIPTILFRVMKLIEDPHLFIFMTILVISVGYLFLSGGEGDTT